MTIHRPARSLPARMRDWFETRRRHRREIDAIAALDSLNSHLLRDIGMRRDRPAEHRFPEY